MPFIASSVQGLPAPADRWADATRSGGHDGARPATAAVCRHLLGDAFHVSDEDLRKLERALAS